MKGTGLRYQTKTIVLDLIVKSTIEATVLGFGLGIIGIRVQDCHFTKYEHAAVDVDCSQFRH